MARSPQEITVTVEHLDRLTQMMDMQREFQRNLNGYDVDDQSVETRIGNFRESVLALTDELHEALNEMGWKSWATSRHFNTESVQGELIDAWHFMMNLFLHAGMTPEDIYKAYMAKHEINVQRQEDGYDGVSTKCPKCKRALDDKGVKCMAKNPTMPAWCAMWQGHYGPGAELMGLTGDGDWVMAGAA